MTTYKQQVERAIAELKTVPPGTVTVSGYIRSIPFDLVNITTGDNENLGLIRLLSRWRKKHEVWFPAQFPVTEKRTKVWLKNRVLDESDRLLFMIRIHGTYRGHVGLYRFDFDNQTCEIDNIVRGRSGVKGMMEAAIQSMMDWGSAALKLRGYTLQTTSDNIRAIALYTRLGFIETHRVPLVYEKTADGGQWTEAIAGQSTDIKRYDVYMKKEMI